jgi:hypothetical protein
MKKGRISLLSFEDEEELPEKIVIVKPQEARTSASRYDLSQIKDRVTQMDLNEEIVIDGEEADALFGGDENTGEFCEDSKIKEAIDLRRRMRDSQEQQEEQEDYMPITTKAEYWLQRDTRESEEQFAATDSSRLVRENLFNEVENDNAAGSFTSFFGKSSSGGTRTTGLMMTAKMLERDIKSDIYDFELSPQCPNEEASQWEQAQIIKGLEKGWTPQSESFLIKQTKLSAYFNTPPKPETTTSLADLQEFETQDTAELTLNIERITQDSLQLAERMQKLKVDIEDSQKTITDLDEYETFFIKFARFVAEKMPQLKEIETHADMKDTNFDHFFRKWEHFFDNDDAEFVDLPLILQKYQELNLYPISNTEHLAEIIGLFLRYHFLALKLVNGAEVMDIYEASGLKSVLENCMQNDPLILIKEVYKDNPDTFEEIMAKWNIADNK